MIIENFPIVAQKASDVGRRWCLGVGMAIFATAGAALSSPAQAEDLRLVVFGDSLADGIWAGIYRALRTDGRFEIDRHTRVSSGLSRPDFYDWDQSLDTFLASEDLNIAVVSIGLNDGQPVYHDGRWDHDFATPEWDEIYAQRVSDFMAQLDAADIPSFWVGLPTVRSDDFGERVAHMNSIYQSAASGFDNVHFVSTTEVTADTSGAYSAYLEDEDGRQRLMRANDGIHFTSRGYERLGISLVAAMQRELEVFQVNVAEDSDP